MDTFGYEGNSSLLPLTSLTSFSSQTRRQKIRRFHPDRQRVIQEIEIAGSRIHQRVSYPDWLANVVVVPKKRANGECVDYTNLNNACPKDSFPLPRIDQIVDSTSGQGMLSFLDAFSGYHQIPMSPDDEEKTAFITPHGLYCYKVMPFGLKNAGATYQRLMTKIFKPLIGPRSRYTLTISWLKAKLESSISSIYKKFFLLRKYDMKLNPSKCAFGVSAGNFWDLCDTKSWNQGWTDNCQNALERIKHCLMHPPILSSPIPKEKLYMYLAVSEWAISAALFRCPSPKEQKPVYYVSRALADVETRYSKMELTALALRSAAQKLRPYFQAHPVIVLTDQPLRSILHKPDLTGRMLQWAIELSEFGIEFQPRLSKKGQVMADFVLEYSRRPNQHHESSEQEWWTLRVDGASRSSGSGVGLVLQSPTGEHLEQAIRLGFSASNNEAEYEAILSGLDLALALSVSKLRIYSDSQLVLPPSHQRSHSLPIHVQANPSVAENSTCNTIEANQTDDQEWTHDIAEYLRTGTLPEDLNKRTKSGCSCPFHPDWGHLYKRSFTGPYLRCLGHSEAQYVLAELHEGICGNHTGGRSLAHRAHSQGYYWPTMKKDAAAYVQKCDKCQRYAPIPHMPSAALKSVSGPWPFAQWGMDIVGPLPAAPAQKKFLLVATDYFSKWVEAEAYASIKDKDVTKFVWKNIVCRFGIPQIIIADNGPQFDSIAFRNFCSELNIRNSYSTPRYPQSNGQAEATNKTLINALKKRLEQAKGKWVEELPGVLWAYRTTPGRPTGNTPFALTYGMDAVIPTEIGLPTIRTDAAKQKDANTELGRNLDWADEVRESASIRMADYQQRASAHYNRKVRPRNFKNGTLVLRKVFENTAEVGAGKFQANWEGPYIVSKANENGAYHLQKLDGTPLLRPWNVFNLKQYYQ
ncbi:Retrovirus-related Pol polyprotein from transposon 17.6 [Vitis vinifera]|uniref:Retrovirus-related Pol polyprotein from transposon 17.6 n=1 Tax=Vitis vinifera TaxID=29760 RepID=A0A438HXS6_VITVI|nr:Retrovirus-related Pol polyprotein from transposon 17.6 [Vitis vinifera]